MSLDNIQMPPILVQNLYRRSLVALDSDQQESEPVHKPAFNFLGKNERSILLIVDVDGTAFLPDQDLSFLMGVLSACKITMADVALVNKKNSPGLAYDTIMEEFKPGKIIFFGVQPANLDFPLQFPEYKLQNYNSQVYLSAPDLSTISSQKDQKVLLWNCLKTMFEIS
jgi:hypothetical protein